MKGSLQESGRFWISLLCAVAFLVSGAARAQDPAEDEVSETPVFDLATVDVDALAEALAVAVADDVRRDWSVPCDAADFNIYDTDVVHKIQLTVSNKGECPFTVKVVKSGVAAPEDFVVPAGTPTTINRSNVTKITIDCGNDPAHKCAASYTLTEGP